MIMSKSRVSLKINEVSRNDLERSRNSIFVQLTPKTKSNSLSLSLSLSLSISVNKTVVQLARDRPTSNYDLFNVDELAEQKIREYGAAITSLIRRAGRS